MKVNLKHVSFRQVAITLGGTLMLLGLVQCQPKTKIGGGISLTFDDQNVKEWVAYAPLLEKYGVKATFFINRPYELTPEEIKGLHKLKAAGHEIGCHGMNHLNSHQFINKSSKYLAEEVIPAAAILDSLGLTPVSFAYPFGAGTRAMDRTLQKEMTYLRKATWN